MRDPRFPHEIATILPGEYFVSSTPMIVYTVLGSCVAACIRDPVAGVGGMNHFMLPVPNGKSEADSWGASTRYGLFAMEQLINELLKRGGEKRRLEIKLFGGGRIYEGAIDVGARNVAWVKEFLTTEGLPIAGEDLGDIYPRKIYYFVETGRVLMKKIEHLHNRTIHEREAHYAQALAVRQPEGDVTLF